MADLISIDRAKAQLNNSTCDDAAISAAISAVSTFVENYCGRKFSKQTFDELYTVAGVTPYIELTNPPVTKIKSVRTGRIPALYIQYNDLNNQYQYANVEVNSTGVTLSKFSDAVETTNSFEFASYPTFTLLQDAINNVAGWKATGSTQFANWATFDLNLQGTFGARNQSVPLVVYWQYIGNFRFDAERGEIYLPGGAWSGYQEYRIQYVGGYADIPEDLQQAVAELVQQTLATKDANPLMTSETLDKYSYTRAAQSGFDTLSVTSRKAIQSYRIFNVARYK